MSDPSSERKMCIACKHHAAPQYSLLQCVRPELMQISPVDGKEYGKPCEFERAAFSEGCGQLGRFFSPINK
jgi:hypothetical protein